MKAALRVALLVLIAAITFLATPLLLYHFRESSVRRTREHAKILAIEVRRSNDANALQELVAMLRSNNENEKLAAIIYLREAGAAGASAGWDISTILRQPNKLLAREAAITLGYLGPMPPTIVSRLFEAAEGNLELDSAVFSIDAIGKVADPEDEMIRQRLKAIHSTSDDAIEHWVGRAIESLDARKKKM